MRGHRFRCVQIFLALLVLAPSAWTQGKGHQKYRGGSHTQGPLGIVVVFTPQEREIIYDWFWHNRNGLPPGLAKRETLPPGLQKQLQRNGTLPPGLQKKLTPLPYTLDSRLAKLSPDLLRVVIGRDVILLNRRNNVILDVVSDILRDPDPTDDRRYATRERDDDRYASQTSAPASTSITTDARAGSLTSDKASPPQPFHLSVRMTQALSTETAQAGHPFIATLEEAVYDGNRLVARKGALAEGRVVDSDKGGRVKGVASLTLKLTRFRMTSGEYAEITTDPVEVDANATKGEDATKIALATGIGAGVGALVGGGKGAAVGAATGAATGTGVVLATRGDPAVIPSESVLKFAVRSY